MDESTKSSTSAGENRVSALSVQLREALSPDPTGKTTLGTVLDRIGEKGFGVLLLCLSLPSALPVPAPFYSTPFGLLIVLLAGQLLAGRQSIWLPRRARSLTLDPKLRSQMLAALEAVLRRTERFIRPRQRWVGSRVGRVFLGALLGLMGLLMVLPIPLTNTASAAVVFLIALGLTEEDGVVCLIGALVAGLAVALYGGVVWLFVVLVQEVGWAEAGEALRDQLKAWFEQLRS